MPDFVVLAIGGAGALAAAAGVAVAVWRGDDEDWRRRDGADEDVSGPAAALEERLHLVATARDLKETPPVPPQERPEGRALALLVARLAQEGLTVEEAKVGARDGSVPMDPALYYLLHDADFDAWWRHIGGRRLLRRVPPRSARYLKFMDAVARALREAAEKEETRT